MPASESSILDSFLLAAKKLPGQVVGGGVDITNMVMGGGANIVDVLRGKEITREIGEGLVPKPVGGTEWINEKFGIPNKSTGLAEDSISAVMNALTPQGAIAGASKALIVAAGVGSSPKLVAAAKKALAEGTDPAQVFKYTGVYEGPIDKKLRTVIDDSQSQINPDVLVRTTPLGNTRVMGMTGPERPVINAPTNATNLNEILGHPTLYDLYPELKTVSVMRGSQAADEATTYNSLAGSRIEMGPSMDINKFHSTLLHEVQHVIQNLEGFSAGASPKAFLPSPKFYESFTAVQNAARELTSNIAKKFGLMPEDVVQMAQNPAAKSSGIFTDPDFQLYLRTRRAQAKGIEVEKEAVAQYKRVGGEAEARAVQYQFRDFEPGSLAYPLHIYDDASFPLIPSPYDAKILSKPVTSQADSVTDITKIRAKKDAEFDAWQAGSGNVDDIFRSLNPPTLSKGATGSYAGKRAEVVEVGSGNRVVLKDEDGRYHYGIPASELKSFGIKR